MRWNLLKTILNFAVTSQLKVEAAVNKALTHFAARKETNLLLRSTRRVSSCFITVLYLSTRCKPEIKL